MIALFYITLSIITLFIWQYDLYFCAANICNGDSGLFQRSWYLWGTLFYVFAAILCIEFKKNTKVLSFLAAGAIIHVGLIINEYVSSGGLCPVCLKIACVEITLVILYGLLNDSRLRLKHVMSTTSYGLMTLALFLIIINPSNHVYEPKQIAYEAEFTGIKNNDTNDTDDLINTEKTYSEIDKKDSNEPYKIEVRTANGQEEILDLRKKSILVFATWCPHCDEALEHYAVLSKDQRPLLAVTYLRGNDVGAVRDKLSHHGLDDENFYLMDNMPGNAKGVPAVLYWDNGISYRILGSMGL